MSALDVFFRIATLSTGLWESAKNAVDETAEAVYQESAEVFVPVLTGLLKSTAKNQVIVDNMSEYTRAISYDTYYAWKVHEIPNPHFNPPTATWKYLSKPLEAQAAFYASRIRRARLL